ncbi:ABC transporter permease [Paremcibacter congregatus]|uniref:ABC transporter permease n=1 Tax=Paremcibacter congregatus TaxID=2043170 RepID=UPI0030EF5207|tara:strand:+ start:165 stop:2606 length:2442 start_codon:yes stop_codon:yes gene_type:complete
MFKSYVMIALRNLMQNKLYSLINVGGLAIGMAVFIFAGILVDYEKNHDTFFEKSDRIYTLGSLISPTAGHRENRFGTVYLALAPLLEADVPDIELTARVVEDEYLLLVGERRFYQTVKFVDKAFLKIFDFDYIAGDSGALDDPSGIVLTESMARKYFPDGNALGKVLSISFHSKADLRVTAIIRDLPRNSHFVPTLSDTPALEALVSLDALTKMDEFKPEGDWSNISSENMTYVLLPPHLDETWLSQQADAVYKRHASKETQVFIPGVDSRRLQDTNLLLWESVGWPVADMLELLGLLILLIAGLNYTNLATAQAFGRAREVGLRKTMGATMPQLLSQFLVESIATAMLAMLVALALLEILVPLFNDSLGKALALNYVTLLPTMVFVGLLVGLVAGSYPAYVITRAKPIDAMKNILARGPKGSLVRSCMIAAQFVFSIFMLGMVAVVFFQNEKIKEDSNIFPRSQIVTLKKAWLGDMQSRHDLLKQEVMKVPGVTAMTFSSQVPFMQQNWTFQAARNAGDMAGKVNIHRIHVEYDFLKTYDIPLIAGRDFSRDVAQDRERDDSTVINVVVNEMALKYLGYSSVEAALGQTFHQVFTSDSNARERSFVIVGVVADQNFLGLQNSIKPIVFRVYPEYYEQVSIRVESQDFGTVMTHIAAVWQKVNPNHPIQVEFLDETFERGFKLYSMINMALAGFALVAITLAFIGLFGLAAFMAAGRTKEIGIRKVMGAETFQIVRLLIWQFSRPVIWGLVVALPLSFFAANRYLAFFAARIEFPVVLILAAGGLSVVLSWMIVSVHAYRVSRQKPIKALRYE